MPAPDTYNDLIDCGRRLKVIQTNRRRKMPKCEKCD